LIVLSGVVGCLWRVLKRVTWTTVLTSSLVMAGLFVSKFSAPLVMIMGLALMAIQLCTPKPLVVTWRHHAWELHARSRRLAVDVAVIAVHAVIAWVVIW